MKKSKAMKILEKTALAEGVSVAEVRLGIQEAIDHAYENRKPADVFWHKWGGKPSVEEFLAKVNNETVARLNFANLKQ
jgi:hypothetical protein